jgi:pectinesterase
VAAPVSYRLGPAGRFPSAIHDLKSAVRWLRANASRYGIDPTQVGAVGGSAGGHLVALLGASAGVVPLEGEGAARDQPSDVQAVVDIDGAVEFPDAALIEQEENAQGATSRFLGGGYRERGKAWHEASPIAYVGPRSAPTLFINSTAPAPILPGRAEMSARLRAIGIDSAVVVIPDTPHPFWLVRPWFDRVLDETDRFLRRHLGRDP